MKVREAPQDKERTELTREIPWVAVGVPVLSIITTCRRLDPVMGIIKFIIKDNIKIQIFIKIQRFLTGDTVGLDCGAKVAVSPDDQEW